MMIMFILYFLRFGRSGWYLRLVGNKMCFSSIDCWEEHANASRRELIFIMTILPIVALSDGIFIRYLFDSYKPVFEFLLIDHIEKQKFIRNHHCIYFNFWIPVLVMLSQVYVDIYNIRCSFSRFHNKYIERRIVSVLSDSSKKVHSPQLATVPSGSSIL